MSNPEFSTALAAEQSRLRAEQEARERAEKEERERAERERIERERAERERQLKEGRQRLENLERELNNTQKANDLEKQKQDEAKEGKRNRKSQELSMDYQSDSGENDGQKSIDLDVKGPEINREAILREQAEEDAKSNHEKDLWGQSDGGEKKPDELKDIKGPEIDRDEIRREEAEKEAKENYKNDIVLEFKEEINNMFSGVENVSIDGKVEEDAFSASLEAEKQFEYKSKDMEYQAKYLRTLQKDSGLGEAGGWGECICTTEQKDYNDFCNASNDYECGIASAGIALGLTFCLAINALENKFRDDR